MMTPTVTAALWSETCKTHIKFCHHHKTSRHPGFLRRKVYVGAISLRKMEFFPLKRSPYFDTLFVFLIKKAPLNFYQVLSFKKRPLNFVSGVF